ncbi:MAG: PRC-barrel domain-containing protein [Aquaticitalea sp.]
MTEHKKHLYYMNELSDYKISDGYPDVRGWDVKDIDHRVIGKVDNLLVNPEAQRVVYLDVEVDKTIIDAKHDPYGRPNQADVREFVNKDGENHIIVPIGMVDLNTDSNFVYTDILDHRTFAETKRFRKGDNVNRAYEVQVLDSYRRRNRAKETDDSVLRNRVENYDDSMTDRENTTFDTIPNESRIREIVRQEIRDYHNNNNNRDSERGRNSDDVDDYTILTDEEREFERRRRKNDMNEKENETYADLPNESRIRAIVREEIRKYHNKDKEAYGNQSYSDDDAVILTDEEKDLERRRRNDDVNDDDRFYERREFDDNRFRKNRTPGL